jgi:hypothetical protein
MTQNSDFHAHYKVSERKDAFNGSVQPQQPWSTLLNDLGAAETAISEVSKGARMRAQAQGQHLLTAASAIAPSQSTIKGLGVACMLAAGAFVLTMLKDPPKSVASDPTAATVKSVDIQVPTGIPAGDCLTYSVCP